YGARTGEGAAREAASQVDDFLVTPLENEVLPEPTEPLDLTDIRNSLTALMWRSAGVRRNGPQLADAADQIDTWQRYVSMRQFFDPAGWELQNMLLVARIMIEAAGAREESRGVHLRTDFPNSDDRAWRRRISFRRTP
ncbi:MAG: L-aspartate oxidase, partial [Planctomycetes bacterium]|nr:L-aspartate oxidase [Planctomycetota bacterium]